MTEKFIEKSLVAEIKRLGGYCVKFVSPGWAGVPDRLILMPNGKAYFAELKAPGKKLRKQQKHRMKQLNNKGFVVFVIDSLQDVQSIGNLIKSMESDKDK